MPAPSFHATLAKERARVDRNSHVFSLVSFELASQGPDRGPINRLAHQLKKEIRITDEIGWLDNNSIGVLLFNALDNEAKKFIAKIQGSCLQTDLFKYSISTYPEDKVDHSHGHEPGACYHSMPGSTSLHCHQGAAENKIAQKLHPIFFVESSAWKRVSDVLLSAAALIALSPLMLTIAIAIKMTSQGPVFFKQQRAGLGGFPFTFLKFRTMHIGAEEKKSELLKFNKRTGPVFKMDDDPRITGLGKFLRKWSLDELPQFVNVLLGDMSLVGPRPPTLDEVKEYESWHNYRLEVKPGITCIWQVYARHEKSFENWVRLDIKYKREQSFLLDMKILALTLPAVLSRRGAS
jgi:lipopolysaccharide/colanic/teichoic acid biosynthesis glycosyltransferase